MCEREEILCEIAPFSRVGPGGRLWIRASDAARLAGVDPNSIRYLMRSGKFTTWRVGCHVFIPLVEAQEYRPDPTLQDRWRRWRERRRR